MNTSDHTKSDDPAVLHSELATLRLELERRDKRIASMEAEYAALQLDKERAERGGDEATLARAFKPLVNTLSNWAMLEHWAAQGQAVETADLLRSLRDLEKQLGKSGLERIGQVGETCPFDPVLHQRMSGGSVAPNALVSLEMPGYRLGGRVLLKAMVSAGNGD